MSYFCITSKRITPSIHIQGAVADHAYESLIEVGVDVKRSQAGFYLFPNFEKCRAKLEAKGVKTGQDMCDLLFDEKRIAVKENRKN